MAYYKFSQFLAIKSTSCSQYSGQNNVNVSQVNKIWFSPWKGSLLISGDHNSVYRKGSPRQSFSVASSYAVKDPVLQFRNLLIYFFQNTGFLVWNDKLFCGPFSQDINTRKDDGNMSIKRSITSLTLSVIHLLGNCFCFPPRSGRGSSVWILVNLASLLIGVKVVKIHICRSKQIVILRVSSQRHEWVDLNVFFHNYNESATGVVCKSVYILSV